MPGFKRHQTAVRRSTSRARTASVQPQAATAPAGYGTRSNTAAGREASQHPAGSAARDGSETGNAEGEAEDDDDIPLRDKVSLAGIISSLLHLLSI